MCPDHNPSVHESADHLAHGLGATRHRRAYLADGSALSVHGGQVPHHFLGDPGLRRWGR